MLKNAIQNRGLKASARLIAKIFITGSDVKKLGIILNT